MILASVRRWCSVTQVNRSYAEMAAHYGSSVLPARPRSTAAPSRVTSSGRLEMVSHSWPFGQPAAIDRTALHRANVAPRTTVGRSAEAPLREQQRSRFSSRTVRAH
ncbi:hypothetical protein DNR46_27235 [Mesorhizobium japonicum]|uniref:Transposase n=1 Tax=Mesorhizobium japonicum TaxID=2066070 RepID=A0A3M9X4P4_9HYPH|nr:hypothetical protein DNR46_27235 [Mesorhizobium japonicum]